MAAEKKKMLCHVSTVSLRVRHLSTCEYVCPAMHADELEVEKIAFLQPLNHKEPTKRYTLANTGRPFLGLQSLAVKQSCS